MKSLNTMIRASAVAILLMAAPAASLAAGSGATVHISRVSEFGLDAIRAAAVAGGPVQPIALGDADTAAISERLSRAGYGTGDVEHVYVDADGEYWVFVEG